MITLEGFTERDVAGGWVAHQQFVADLIKAIDDEVFIRQWANTIPVIGSTVMDWTVAQAPECDVCGLHLATVCVHCCGLKGT